MASSLANTCRCCLTADSDNLLAMTDTLLFDESDKVHKNPKILDCYSECCVGPTIANRGPLKICPNCRLALQNCTNFRDLCQKSNETFQNLWINAGNVSVLCETHVVDLI
jgi:Zinc-finger associated domain (zf-AD)